MKASESVARYDSEVRLYTNYAIKNIKKVFRKVCPFKTYSLLLPLILSYNQQMGGL